MKKSFKFGFSLLELSVVILVIGLLVIGIAKGSTIINQAQLKSARALTTSSPVSSIPDLSIWLEPSLENSITNRSNNTNPSNNDFIYSWNDSNSQATSKINMIQSTSNNQPTYLSSGINNLPTLSFNGSTSYLITGSGPLSTRDNSYTLIAVFRTKASTSDSWQKIFSQGAFCNGGYIGAVAALAINPSGNTGPGLATCMNDHLPNSYVFNKSYVIIAVVDGQSSKIYTNSNTAQSTTLSSAQIGTTSAVAYIGADTGGQIFNGYISEIITYSRPLKTTEVSSINEYLSEKYNIRIN
jgi:prepilin-type N-terminal cleavage/methylation domain-containing protein